jgi:hypothetical protein
LIDHHAVTAAGGDQFHLKAAFALGDIDEVFELLGSG